ncbi:MAG: hypothetical protein OES20_04370 [Gammaproteobacteria bacterium]|nr:hypothetical protein [Gammaproteobacteria bacterium]MDH3857075.1 hypothetical protein [Gammaproteobacteria bacterium]
MFKNKDPLFLHPYFPFALLLFLVVLGLIHEQLQEAIPAWNIETPVRSELDLKIEDSATALAQQDLSLETGRYSIDILPLSISRGDSEMNKLLRDSDQYDYPITYWYFHDNKQLIYTMSASGVDGKQKLANVYLEGYEPFPVDNVMIPLLVLSQRKSYQLDSIHYFGRQDVWQSSRQAYLYSRGDCEDHALILADWLIAMGEDARVVVGTWNGEGHAWVSLLKDGREYLLEATKKSGLGRNKPYPLASLHTDYVPEYMFNDRYFWVNTGTKYTPRYAEIAWEKRSRFNYLD